jgi:uncharacterized protein YaaW (UPF0174 family)
VIIAASALLSAPPSFPGSPFKPARLSASNRESTQEFLLRQQQLLTFLRKKLNNMARSASKKNAETLDASAKVAKAAPAHAADSFAAMLDQAFGKTGSLRQCR